MKITVLGSGGWGTALALLLLENGHEVTLWSYTEEESRVLRETRENPMLKGVPLPETMGLTTDMGAVKGCGAVVMATPSFAVRATAAKLKQLADPGTIVISVSKGIEKDTSLRLSQVIEEELQGHCPVVVLSGPSHAEEVGRGVPTVVSTLLSPSWSTSLCPSTSSTARSLPRPPRRPPARSEQIPNAPRLPKRRGAFRYSAI